MRRGLLALLAVFALAPLVGACGRGDDKGAEALLTERWLRIGEDPSAEILVYEEKLPPDLVDLLNPDTTTGDKVQLPVHPSGKLVGSYVVRKPDGTHLVWLIYDVADGPGPVTKKVQEQLDARPWQVIGAQADSSGTLLRFQSTTGTDLQGTAIVNQRPGSTTYPLVVKRDGKEVALDVVRAATVPEIAATLEDDLTVKRLGAGVARTAGLKEGDRVVKVGGVDVTDRKSLAAAQQALAGEKAPSTSVTYVVQVSSPGEPGARTFTEPASMSLPEKFPVRAFFDGLTVTEFQWVQQAGASGFSATAITKDGSTTLLGRLREALQKDGWRVLQDVPSSGSTQVQFEHSDGRSGVADIGPFETDSAYTEVVLQVQVGDPARR